MYGTPLHLRIDAGTENYAMAYKTANYWGTAAAITVGPSTRNTPVEVRV